MTDTSRGKRIRELLHLLPDLTTTPPFLHVPWPDFPLWIAHLRADGVTCTLRHDGRVDVTVCGVVGELGVVFVGSVVDRVRDVQLPPIEAGKPRTGVRLPVVELDRCELFAREVA